MADGDRLATVYRQLEFDRPVSIGLNEQATTLWPREWSRIANMTASYGHGIAVTPMHLAAAYAALVNGGVWHPTSVLKLEPGQVPEWPSRLQRGDQRAHAPVAAHDRAERDRPQRQCGRLSHRRQDRHRVRSRASAATASTAMW